MCGKEKTMKVLDLRVCFLVTFKLRILKMRHQHVPIVTDEWLLGYSKSTSINASFKDQHLLSSWFRNLRE